MSLDKAAPYPWQGKAWSQLAMARRQGRLGHAWLVSGRPGLGKSAFTGALARAVLCESPGDSACGNCRSCLLMAAGSHPDFCGVEIPEDKSGILIEQIRELNEFFTLSTHYGRAKVALIRPAEAMNRSAANALLKLLEEPPPSGLLILEAARPDLLLPTLRSRCQGISLDGITEADALAWLASQLPAAAPETLQTLFLLGGRAPLGALAAQEAGLPALLDKLVPQMVGVARGRIHAVQAAQSLADAPVSTVVDLMQRLVHGVAAGEAAFLSQSGAADLLALRDVLHSQPLFGFQADMMEVKRLATSAATLRQADLSETLWLAWMKATRTRRRRA
ncbi:MAG: DNA polymerase III subunit delta' [Gammaproteobacteria bacterium]|nr:DNA polymerase III subunit delta' [Gammaproteobacteria bacterium]